MALNKIKYAYSCPRQRLNSITPPRARDLLSAAYENRGQKITTRWMIRGQRLILTLTAPRRLGPFGIMMRVFAEDRFFTPVLQQEFRYFAGNPQVRILQQGLTKVAGFQWEPWRTTTEKEGLRAVLRVSARRRMFLKEQRRQMKPKPVGQKKIRNTSKKIKPVAKTQKGRNR